MRWQKSKHEMVRDEMNTNNSIKEIMKVIYSAKNYVDQINDFLHDGKLQPHRVNILPYRVVGSGLLVVKALT